MAMPVITAENLTKVFRVQQKEPGLAGAVKALFKPHHKEKTAAGGGCFSITRLPRLVVWPASLR